VSSTGVPEESSRRSEQQLENSVGRDQFWCEGPACHSIFGMQFLSDIRVKPSGCTDIFVN